MIHTSVAQLFEVGKDILATYLDKATNVILAQIGDSTQSVPDSDAAEWWQHTGFASRPAKPTPGNASCQGIHYKRGDRDCIIATRDTRSAQIYGNLKDGETAVFASTGAARVLFKDNGAVVAYTTNDNTEDGTGISVYIGPDKIQIMNSYGSITIDSTGISLSSGTAALTLGQDGAAHLLGQTAAVTGSGVSISGSVATSIGGAPNSKTLIGTAATPVTGAAYGPPGPGIVALASAGVFISPV